MSEAKRIELGEKFLASKTDDGRVQLEVNGLSVHGVALSPLTLEASDLRRALFANRGEQWEQPEGVQMLRMSAGAVVCWDKGASSVYLGLGQLQKMLGLVQREAP